jgi:NAD(P)-dependent dehydrogenase (short-subunit alcohol dehydrogenase family)
MSPELSSELNPKPLSRPRTVLITGAARRIGRALALGFAARGWDVGVHYHTSGEAAAEVVREIEALGRRAVALQADLADAAAVLRLVPACTEALGLPTCLVNNASLFEEDTAQTFTAEMLARLNAVNVSAPLALARALHAALPDLAEAGAQAEDGPVRGVVINLLDQKLFNLNPDYLSYTLTKAALQTATVTLAQALAPKLRVVGLAPGLTLPWAAHQNTAEFEAAHRHTPLQRASRPQDIVAAACYLAEASAVTGTTLVVDGGQHLVPLPRDIMFLQGGQA